MFVKEEYCVYDKLFLLTCASWEAEEELEKENIKVVVHSNDQQNNTQLQLVVLDNNENVNPVVNAYKCTACSKEFTPKSDFDRHMKIHSGIKDYKCNVCFKEYTRKSTLDTHMKVHTGVKEYKCDVCYKEFTQKYNLK